MYRALALSLLALALLASHPSHARAENLCLKLANRTANVVTMFSKTSPLTMCTVDPFTVGECCCENGLPGCFDKEDGTSKIKVVRLDKNGLDRWSGMTCFKMRVLPEHTVVASIDLDGSHIQCAYLDPGVEPNAMPDFTDADLNKDGSVDLKEAARLNVEPKVFKGADMNQDAILNKLEYERKWRNLNTIHGYEPNRLGPRIN